MNNRTALLSLVSPAALSVLAGKRSFQLGREYFERGAVSHLTTANGTVRAYVAGSESYRVALRESDGELSYRCSCPYADEGNFCKHCVAVGLALLESLSESSAQIGQRTRKKRHDPWSEIQEYLCKQENDMLIALVLEAARHDDRMYRSLLLKSKRDMGSADLSKAFHETIDSATRIAGFVAWNDVPSLAETLNDVVDSLEELLQPTTSNMLVGLAEFAIERVEAMLGEVDDSDGRISEIVARLGDLHLAACRTAQPAAEALAERLEVA